MPDYILTLVEQIGILLRELARARRSEKPQRLSAMFLRETGLPLDFARHTAPETILQLLQAGGGTQYFRAVVMAELLLEDAALNESAGKRREALIARAQARALLAHSIDHLSPEDQSIYKDKLDALTTELRRASP